MDLLTAMSDYYRIRRVLIEDETYISLANEEISYEDKDTDTVQLKRVKKLMRSSFFLTQNLSNELNGAYKVPMGFEGHADEASMVRKKIDYDSNKKRDEKNKEIRERLKYYGKQTKDMNELENFRYFIAPKWMENSLSLDPEKQVSTPKAKGEIFSSGHTITDKVLTDDIIKKNGRDKFIKDFMGIPKTKKKAPKATWGGSPKFEGGEDTNLEKLEVSDSYDRLTFASALEYGYRRTNAEMMEMFDYLSIQMDKEKWDRADEDARAFYESAYKEMAMKQISIVYSSAVRLAESIAMEVSILHPIDLLMQMDTRLRACLLNNSIITNIDMEDNIPLMKELFDKEDTDGRYGFDIDKLRAYSGMVSTLDFSISSFIGEIVNMASSYDDDEYDELREAYFGDVDFYRNVIEKEYEKAMDDQSHPDHDMAVKFNGTPSYIAIWYFDNHPEYLTPEYLCKRIGKDKKSVISNALMNSFQSKTTGDAKDIAYCLENGLVNKISKDKLDRYNESLIKRNFPKIRYQEENDDPDKDVKIRIGGEVKGTVKMSQIIANRNADPYGVYAAGEGYKELRYTDETGQAHYLSNQFL